MAFCKDLNSRTQNEGDMIIPVEITVYADRSFTFITQPPGLSSLSLSTHSHLHIKNISSKNTNF